MMPTKQRWKNLGVQQIITPRRNVLADIFYQLADNFDHLAGKNVRETFLRGLIKVLHQGFSTPTTKFNYVSGRTF